MAWKQLHNNIPYGFSGKMDGGTYIIGDIQHLLGDLKLGDGIWKNMETGHSICILTTGLGYYKLYNSTSIKKFGVERKVAIMDTRMIVTSIDSHNFISVKDLSITANEIYGTLKIYADDHIIVEFEDPSDSESDGI
jgi:hypothetical protein